ncbi:MAG: methionyl-tRNA formyltransferase [Clostridiales bacterium]|nr:methionyl-tRNA formyltransferase [Clostridiales bacterium]
MRVVFMGTPQFAVPVLEALNKEHEVIAVVTQPDAPKGRSKKLIPSPVKVRALELGLQVHTYEKVRAKEAAQELENFQADVFVTAAYGQILSQRNLDAPKYGVINAHASLLPKYRGSAPVNWCLINGESITGVTTMYTARGVDTGDMIYAEEVAIDPYESAEELLLRLAPVAAGLVLKTLAAIESGTCPRTPQKEEESSYYPMLTKEDGKLDFTQSAAMVAGRCRGVTPWPGAYGFLDGQRLKLFDPRVMEGSGEPGQVLQFDKNGMVIACGSGAIRFLRVQPDGKKPMNDVDFIRGKKETPGGFSL